MPLIALKKKAHASSVRIVWASGLSCALVVALVALYAYQDYRESTARGEATAAAQAAGLAAFATRTFQNTETVMLAAAAIALADGAGAAATRAFIATQLGRRPEIAALQVIEADGTTAGGPTKMQVLRAWALTLPAEPDALAVGATLDLEGVPVRAIPLGLRLPGKAGGGLIVAAALRADFLVRFREELDLPDHSLSVVVDKAGRIMARAPYLPEAIGLDIASSALFRATPPGVARGIAYGRAPSDGVLRVIGVRRDTVYPFTVASGFSREAMLAPWRVRLWRDMELAGVLLAVIGVLTRFAWLRAQTEQAASRALLESEENHRIALESLSEGVTSVDREGAALTWNPAALRILAISADELGGRKLLDPRWQLTREDGGDFPLNERPVARALATGEPQLGVTLGVLTPDRGLRWLSASAVAIHHEGAIVGAVSSFVDITAQREADARIRTLAGELEATVVERTAQLRRANDDLAELVYSIAHTMRAPLRQIDSFATLLHEDASTRLSADEDDLLRRIRGGAALQLALVDSLLKYTAVRQREPDLRPLDMDTLVDAAVARQTAIAAAGPAIEWIRAPLPAMTGDATLTAEILDALLSNAVKFSSRRARPRIEIRGCGMAGAPGIEIADNGVGFDMRYTDKLFGVFQRLHIGEEFDGVGIELALCRRLVEAQGGRIEADGEAGSGARFRFSFGAASTAAAPAGA